MKINIQSEAAITEALKKTNGNAGAHTFSAFELENDCALLEKRLEDAGVAKLHRQGCSAILLSGHKLPNNYTYSVIRNRALVQRGATGWFLTSVSREENRSNTGFTSTPEIFLTQAAMQSMLQTKGMSLD